MTKSVRSGLSASNVRPPPRTAGRRAFTLPPPSLGVIAAGLARRPFLAVMRSDGARSKMAGVPHAAPEPVMIRLVDSSVTAARRERGASGAVERAGQRWPVTGDGTPLSFIAQISTGDISAPGGRLPLPAGFLLAFFYEAVGQEAWGNDPKPPPDQPMRRRPGGLHGSPHRLASEGDGERSPSRSYGLPWTPGYASQTPGCSCCRPASRHRPHTRSTAIGYSDAKQRSARSTA